jgi:sugar/nucleoside kinase (ribokinase family)
MPDGYDVLVWDVYFCDLVFTGLPQLPQLGGEVFGTDFDMTPGGAFSTVSAMHRLGLRVGWICDFGNDFFSQFILAEARREGLDSSLFRIHPYPVRRISAAFSFAHDRGFISFMDKVEQPSPIPLLEQHRPACLFLPHLHFDRSYTGLFAAATRHGTLIFMECQSNDATLETPGVVEALQAVDIFAPNEAEARQLTGESTAERALARLAELTPVVIVKRGSRGAIARAGEQVVTVPAIPVACRDTTGAGDCFNAGFLYGYLRGDSLERCVQLGNICGGLSTTVVGSGAALLTKAQVEAYLNHYQSGRSYDS